MRAAILNEINAPMTVEDLPTPSPKAGEALLRIAATGVCHTDLHVMRGEVAFPTPCVLGHETSGTVEAIGDGVTNVAVGEPRRVQFHHAVRRLFILPHGAATICARRSSPTIASRANSMTAHPALRVLMARRCGCTAWGH